MKSVLGLIVNSHSSGTANWHINLEGDFAIIE
jgi:hypothetical protein